MIRLDDRSRNQARSLLFAKPTATGRAESLAEVIPTIAAASDRRDAGEWVVMAIAYEAAPAFEATMRTHEQPPPGMLFVWWQSFAAPAAGPELPTMTTRVRSRERMSNLLPYTKAVDEIRCRIELGDVYQVNLTERFVGTYDGTPFDMYAALVGVQSCEFGAYLELDASDLRPGPVIASASPELFFRWDGDQLTCRPMKGTAPRHPRPDVDEQVADTLLASEKDRAENVMIVDLLRNDLSRVAELGSVTVPELFTLERYETVWQLTSTVTARVAPGATLVDLLTALFPCGSVTGAPKIAAMDVIAELESTPRGIYCGAIGMLAPDGEGSRAVFSVPIRTAVLDPLTSTYVYGAGGGITWFSDPQAEDDEVNAKARILQRQLRTFDLFETMRLDVEGVHNRSRHLDRLAASASWWDVPFDRASAEALLDALDHPTGTRRIRLLVGRDGAIRVEDEPLVAAGPEPVALAIDSMTIHSEDPFCCHKTTWRKHYDEARARHLDADDVILVNEHGHAVETTIANLAYRIGDTWYTPPLIDGGLAGVGRAVALAEGRLVERSISALELAAVEELAVVSSLRGWRAAYLIKA